MLILMKKTSPQQDVLTSLQRTFIIKCCRSRITAGKGTFPLGLYRHFPNGLKKALITWATCHYFMDCTSPAAAKASLQLHFQNYTFCFWSFSIWEGLNKVWTILQNGVKENKKNRKKRGEADSITAPSDRLNPVVSSRFKKPRNTV